MIKGKVQFFADEVQTALARLQDQFSANGVAAILEETGKRLKKTLILKYPPATGAPMADLWTDKQRRWFWANFNAGKIKVPYPRTGDLSRQLTFLFNVSRQSAVFTISVPSTPKTEAVLGLKQSRYFRERTNWKPLEKMITIQIDEAGGFDAVIAPVIEKAVQDLQL